MADQIDHPVFPGNEAAENNNVGTSRSATSSEKMDVACRLINMGTFMSESDETFSVSPTNFNFTLSSKTVTIRVNLDCKDVKTVFWCPDRQMPLIFIRTNYAFGVKVNNALEASAPSGEDWRYTPGRQNAKYAYIIAHMGTTKRIDSSQFRDILIQSRQKSRRNWRDFAYKCLSLERASKLFYQIQKGRDVREVEKDLVPQPDDILVDVVRRSEEKSVDKRLRGLYDYSGCHYCHRDHGNIMHCPLRMKYSKSISFSDTESDVEDAEVDIEVPYEPTYHRQLSVPTRHPLPSLPRIGFSSSLPSRLTQSTNTSTIDPPQSQPSLSTGQPSTSMKFQCSPTFSSPTESTVNPSILPSTRRADDATSRQVQVNSDTPILSLTELSKTIGNSSMTATLQSAPALIPTTVPTHNRSSNKAVNNETYSSNTLVKPSVQSRTVLAERSLSSRNMERINEGASTSQPQARDTTASVVKTATSAVETPSEILAQVSSRIDDGNRQTEEETLTLPIARRTRGSKRRSGHSRQGSSPERKVTKKESSED